MKLTKLFSVMGLLAAANVYAQDANVLNLDEYYQVSAVKMVETVPTAAEIAASYVDLSTAFDATLSTAVAIDWNTMFFIGKQIIDILKANASVVNIKRDAVAVVPGGLQSWQQLAGWNAPATKVFNFVVTNRLGMNVVDLRLKVSGNWGGNAQGRGKYLANVIVVPTSIHTLVGWNLDLWTENHDPVNTGSEKSPVAGLGFDIRYKITSLLNQLNGAEDYFVTGDGVIKEVQ